MEFGTVKVLDTSAAPAASSSGSTASESTGSKTNWDLKDKRITWMASKNQAIAILGLDLAAGVVTLPAKKAEKLAALMSLVDDMAQEFYETIYGEPFGG
jgi:hypothetical protein